MIKLKQHPENVNFKRFYMKFGRNRRSTKCVSFLTNARCNLKAPHWTHISRRILVPGKFLYLKVGINQIAMVETSRQPDTNILHVRHLLEIEHSRNSSFSDLISSKIILSLKMARVLIKRTKIKIAINISRIKAEFKNEFKTYKPQLLEEYRIGDNSLPNLLENSTVPCKVSLTKIQPDNPMLKLAIAEANKRQKQISRKINKRVKLHHFKFRCQEDVCTAYFASEELLNQHVQEEHAKPLKCIVAECGKSFMNPNLMEQHLTSNDKNIEHIKEHTVTKCSNIPETFSSASVTDSVRFCHLCHKIVSTNLEQHFQLFHHRCSVCSKLFNYRHDLALHMNFHIDKSKVHECIKSSVNTFELDDDELSESCKDQPFKCKEPGCTTSFQIKRYLTDHIRRVHNVRRFVCQFGGCNKAYKNNFDYIKHLKLHEEKSAGPGIKINPVKCQLNQKVNDDLLLSTKNFKCQKCFKFFMSQFELEDHVNSEKCMSPINTKVKARIKAEIKVEDGSFKCKEPGCTTSFQIKRYLTDHIRRVHNVRRFVCQFGGCNKAYKNNFDYIKHLKLHEEKSAGPGIKINPVKYQLNQKVNDDLVLSTKNFKCQKCFKFFMSQFDLENHDNSENCKSPINTKVKVEIKVEDGSFKCKEPGCTSSFQIKRYLSDHIRRVHRCKKECKNNFDYTRHFKLHGGKSAGPGININPSIKCNVKHKEVHTKRREAASAAQASPAARQKRQSFCKAAIMIAEHILPEDNLGRPLRKILDKSDEKDVKLTKKPLKTFKVYQSKQNRQGRSGRKQFNLK